MHRNKGFAQIALVVIVLLLLGGVVYYFVTDDTIRDVKNPPAESGAALIERSETTTESAVTMEGYIGVLLAGSVAPLLDFTLVDYEQAKQSDKLVVLYFYANWCPICKNETATALYPAFNELGDERVIGFRVNYNDSETDSDEKTLAREFGVGYQHTKVFLKNGERILKSPEGWDKARYLAEIGKAPQ